MKKSRFFACFTFILIGVLSFSFYSHAISEMGSEQWIIMCIKDDDFSRGAWLSSYMANNLDSQDYIQNGVRVDYEKVPADKRIIEYDGLTYEVLPALYTEENVKKLYEKYLPHGLDDLTKEQMIYGKRRKNIIFRDGYAYRVKDLNPIIRYDQIEWEFERVSFDEETKKSVTKVTVRTKNAPFYAEASYEITFEIVDGDARFPDYILSGDALVEAFFAAHPEVSDTELRNGTYVSPQTGDSTVFLLPAAALALGGVLLAAKKRKRVN